MSLFANDNIVYVENPKKSTKKISRFITVTGYKTNTQIYTHTHTHTHIYIYIQTHIKKIKTKKIEPQTNLTLI